MWRDKGFQVLLIHPSDYFRIAGISCHLWIYTHLSQWAILDGGDNRAEVKWEKRREKIFSFLFKEERSLEWEQLTTKLWGKDVMENETNILPLWWEGFPGLDGARSQVAGQGNQLGRNTRKCRANTPRPLSLTPCKHVSSSQPFTCGSPARQVPRGCQLILSPLCLTIHKPLSNLWGIDSNCLWGSWGRRLKGYLNGKKKSSGTHDGRATRKGP